VGGDIFDGYEPVACTQIAIDTDLDPDTFEPCNWQ
jgi:hypothetical protein